MQFYIAILNHTNNWLASKKSREKAYRARLVSYVRAKRKQTPLEKHTIGMMI